MLTIQELQNSEIPQCEADVLTLIFFIVDECLKANPHLSKRNGPDSRMSDSEIIALSLTGKLFTNSELGWHTHIKNHHLSLFPHLVERSVFHKRAKNLWHITLIIFDYLKTIFQLPPLACILDSMPIPVCHRARANYSNRWSECPCDKEKLFGYCASKKEHFFGFRLHLVIRPDGQVENFVLAPAAPHDVTVAPDAIEGTQSLLYFLDKGYIGLEKEINADYQLVIPKRANQKTQNPPYDKALLKNIRSQIETVNNLLSELFVQNLRAKSYLGLIARVNQVILLYFIIQLFNQAHKISTMKIAHFRV